MNLTLMQNVRNGWSVLLVSAVLVGSAGSSRADLISLRGGGTMRGKVLPDPQKPSMVIILTERGKTPFHFQKSLIIRVVPEPSALDEYLERKSKASATAQGQHDLALWCESQKLHDLATVHHEAAIAADADFGPSHERLGHVNVNGQWLSGDELRKAQGLIKHKGKWITPEELSEIERNSVLSSMHESWARRIRILRDALASAPEDRRREAEAQLMGIRDKNAIVPLIKVLGSDSGPSRKLLAHVLGAMEGNEASTSLANFLVREADSDVRHAVLEELQRRDDPIIEKILIQALRAESPEIVNRAAWALSNLNAVRSVPNLVGALITSKSEVIMAPAPGASNADALSMAMNGGPVVNIPHGVPAAYNGSTVGYLTGPVVAPGAVAFGLSSAPAYSVPFNGLSGNPYATAGVLGGGGLNSSRGPVPRLIKVDVRNTEVLTALVKLTGQDLGYDQNAWREWLRTSYKPDPQPLKRLPQP